MKTLFYGGYPKEIWPYYELAENINDYQSERVDFTDEEANLIITTQKNFKIVQELIATKVGNYV